MEGIAIPTNPWPGGARDERGRARRRRLALDTFLAFAPEHPRTSYDLLGAREYALFTPREGGDSDLAGYRRDGERRVAPWPPDGGAGCGAPCWTCGMRAVLEDWDVPATTCAYVSDTPCDMAAASEICLQGLGAAWAPIAPVSVQAAPAAEAIFSSVDGLIAWIDGQMRPARDCAAGRGPYRGEASTAGQRRRFHQPPAHAKHAVGAQESTDLVALVQGLAALAAAQFRAGR